MKRVQNFDRKSLATVAPVDEVWAIQFPSGKKFGLFIFSVLSCPARIQSAVTPG
jgi:hypothetical protein